MREIFSKRVLGIIIALVIMITAVPFAAVAAEPEQDLVCISVSAGNDHSVALLSDGTVWAWGWNNRGQLGDDTTTDRRIPVQVSGLTGVTTVSSSGDHTMALKSDGTVWAWGYNWTGQLGDGTVTDRTTPVQVSGLTGVVAVSAGAHHTIALKSDGTVWAWGRNNLYGQLGDGTTIDRHTPVQVSGLTGVTAISAGGNHTAVLKSDGTVWAWGYNYYGQLGNDTTTNRNIPVRVFGLTGVIAIFAGGGHTIALKSDGTVWAWGNNSHGQLGDGTTTDNYTPKQVSGLTGVTAISAGVQHTIALKSDGTVWAWGANWAGQLGDGTTTNRRTPVQVLGLTGVTDIFAGGYHTMALKSDGTVWAWGYNGFGQLGDGTTTDRLLPIKTQTITSVTISPPESIVRQGDTQQFTAEVMGLFNPDQTVTWSVTGRTSNNTVISEDGLLTIAQNERAATLTIRATSTINTAIFGTATVTLISPATIKGNPTNSGTITVADIIAVRDHILGTTRLTDPGELWAADANDDGVINIFDMLTIRNMILRQK
ncbi:MAG: dockerin type I domain-containing protein [Oscillospiraceae bacterium]|nr:dockerin type I domain-containing protein [Oscillospiraceae bacterium]